MRREFVERPEEATIIPQFRTQQLPSVTVKVKEESEGPSLQAPTPTSPQPDLWTNKKEKTETDEASTGRYMGKSGHYGDKGYKLQ